MTDRLHRLRARIPRPGATAGIVAVHVVLALLSFDPMPHPGGDNGGYFALARALLDTSYRDLYDPAEPLNVVYPPVFPAIWAAAMLLGIGSVVAFKLVIIAFSAGAVAFTHRWLLRRMRRGMAHGVALLVAISPGVINLSHWELSDVPFWFFTMAALFAFEGLRPSERGRFWLGVAALVLAYFTRLAALPLAIAAAVNLAIHRQGRHLALLALLLLPLAAAWHARTAAHGGLGLVGAATVTNPYSPGAPADEERGSVIGRRVEGNVVAYTMRHVPRLLIWYRAPRLALLSLIVLGLALVGWAARLRRGAQLPELLLPAYGAVLLLWPPQWSGDRLLLPIYPLLLAYGAEGLRRVVGAIRPRATAATLRIALLVMAGIALPGLWHNVRYGVSCTFFYFSQEPYPCMARSIRDFYDAARYSRETLPGDAVVLSRNPRLFYLISERQGRSFPLTADPQRLFQVAQEAGAEFVVVDYMTDLTPRYLLPALQAQPERVCVFATLGEGRATILRIVSDSTARATAGGGLRYCPKESGG